MIINESDHRDKFDGKNELAFLRNYQKPRVGDFYRKNAKSIFVVRDPGMRLISLYVNKFVQRSGYLDIFKNYYKLTGMRPEKATFRDFLCNYVQRFPVKKLDPHLLPQYMHLRRTRYNSPVRLEHLCDDMRRVVGDYYAEKYFMKKSNSTSDKYSADERIVVDVTSDELNDLFVNVLKVPSPDKFFCSELDEVVSTVYGGDAALYGDVCKAYEVISDKKTPIIDARKYQSWMSWL